MQKNAGFEHDNTSAPYDHSLIQCKIGNGDENNEEAETVSDWNVPKPGLYENSNI